MTHFRKHNKKQNLLPNVKFGLKFKMVGLISLLIVGIFIIFAGFLQIFISDTIEDQMGKRALSVAQSVANIPQVEEAFQLGNPSSVIQEIAEPIRKETGAEFVVVGNREGIRYSHPNPDRIGEKMIEGNNLRALRDGKAHVSRSTGSLGLSIHGRVPILNEAGDIIGVVSVGFLNEDVQGIIANQSQTIWITLSVIVLLGIAGAIFIARYIKKLLSHMEPEEISYLLLQREAILQSTHEGMIAIDNKGIVTLMNTAAKQILFDNEHEPDHFSGKPISELFPHTDLTGVLETGESHYDKEMVLGESVVLVNRVPVYSEGTIAGAVATFRKKTEIEHVTQELVQIKQYANAQRAQTHEFSNKLYTILGLLQLDEKQEAIDFIKSVKNIQQERSQFLAQHVADPVVQGLLQGKFNQGNELGVTMTIHPDSQLIQQYKGKKQEALITGLGNLLENAIESVKNGQEREPRIAIFFTDMGEDIVAEVEDSGPGVTEEAAPYIFEQGYSTKEYENRGHGLALTRHIVHASGGEVILEEGEMGGACFVMIIPGNGGHTDE
ncbi:ATP-binding protein [Lentibacillus jeotgali]|uniref:ATP-binding protein n=1 Tax=Lentibacillus jeotgali TaxID=558169 RepID=UPI0002628F58|nr:sensor histidine kinase [Lentibacillus jeotgali]